MIPKNLLTIGRKSTLSSVPEGADALLLAELASDADGRDILVVTLDDARMEALADNLRYFAPELDVLTLPAWDCLPYDRVSPNNSIISERIETLCRLATESSSKSRIIITPVNSMLQRVPAREVLFDSVFQARAGDKVSREELIAFLVANGYLRSATVNEPGEFAVRGSIIDLCASSHDEALRLDFFGDTLESIRIFDPLTQISGGKITQVDLKPASEILLTEADIERFRKNYREILGSTGQDDPLYQAISEGRKYPGMEHWLPLFYEKLETLFDYLPDAVLVYEHLVLDARKERINVTLDYYDARKTTDSPSHKAISAGAVYHPIPPALLYLDAEEWDGNSGKTSIIQLHPFSLPEAPNVANMGYKNVPNFAADATSAGKTVFDVLKNAISDRRSINAKGQSKSIRTLIACFSTGSRDRLQHMLHEHDFHCIMVDNWNEHKRVTGKTLGLMILPIEHGFESEELLLISEQDLLGERISRMQKKRKRTENFLSEAASLIEGELVVHKEHGIGRFEGLETLTVSGVAHDCLRIIYDGGDKLFVPVENIDNITRYGSDEEGKLDKLGSGAWQSRKAKLKNRIKVAAEELLRVAAERAIKEAPSFTPQSGGYDEFCSRFPYMETEDQLASIEEVREDLASGKPMDRLICGDVGFGKTEVALRAAYMVAQSEHERQQVAVVVPTTLLCRQHYKNFKERFAGFPVRIRQLSRLVTAKEAAETKRMLAAGEVDIVVGTHALLAKTIEFKKLGLLIVDEEQHFGVAQKERLKQLRSDIHVLTLSATPIPRTLQMSLTGIKELSLMATPPVDRLAVRTFVMPFDPVVIREAILREHYRGGRIFYVCPRIKDLEEVSNILSKLVPEVKLVIAHGQMPAAELDDIMNRFYDGVFDVLLSTTIVESGLDVPSANTIILHRADMLGLSQLYQLRGRVGRGKVRAFAYLTTSPRKIPTKLALKRLEVMQTLDSLGAGFSLASHDMDIRGFGNLVGDEQSGHIREVGIELYQDMLKEAIEGLKAEQLGAPVEDNESWSPQINIGLSVQIPEAYVSDLALRLGLYRRISLLTNDGEVEAFAAEMIDRFGPLPEEAEHLLSIVRIKQLCRAAGIDKIDTGPKGAVISFRGNHFVNPDALLVYIAKHPKSVKIRADHKLVLMENWEDAEKRLRGVNRALNEIVRLAG
jgi:transcription-repair coupling factor (superfamily II helicase)